MAKKRTGTDMTTTIPQRHTPEKCPLCGEVPEPPTPPADHPAGKPFKPTAEIALRYHLEQHRPAQPCRHPDCTHVGWKLDWDTVNSPEPGMYFYCDPCGHYDASQV
jgi:hypothetical protein